MQREPHENAIAELVNILGETMKKIDAITDLPEHFRVRSTHALSILRNSSANVINMSIEEIQTEVVVDRPLTHLLDRFVGRTEPPVPQPLTDNSKAEFRKKIEAIIESMPSLTPKEFYDRSSEIEMRGVGKLLGLQITGSIPETITMEHVSLMYEAIKKKPEEDMIEEAIKSAKEAFPGASGDEEDEVTLTAKPTVKTTPAQKKK